MEFGHRFSKSPAEAGNPTVSSFPEESGTMGGHAPAWSIATGFTEPDSGFVLTCTGWQRWRSLPGGVLGWPWGQVATCRV